MAHTRSVAVTEASHLGPSRLLVALAALWMILSLAVGSALTVEPASDTQGPPPVIGTVDR